MDSNERDAVYCVLGELYFQHKALERKVLDQMGSMQREFEQQLNIKNSQIEELIAKHSR